MSRLKKSITLLLSTAIIALPMSTYAKDDDDCYCAYVGGGGYEACQQTTSLGPAVALSALVLGVIVAFALIKETGSVHGHSE